MARVYCKLVNKECVITYSEINCSTFCKKATIKGLKDCNKKTCQYRGQNGCLLKNS